MNSRKIISATSFVLVNLLFVPTANAQINIGARLSAIFASVEAFNANSKAAQTAYSVSSYKTIFSRNASILYSLERETSNFQNDLAKIYKSLPKKDTSNYPSRVTLKQYGNAMKKFVVVHKRHQILAEKCIKKRNLVLIQSCIQKDRELVYYEEAAVSLAVAVPGKKILNWLRVYGNN